MEMFRFYTKGSNNRSERATIVAVQDGKTLKVGAARCSKYDNFCKEKGVSLAVRRINEGKHIAEYPIQQQVTINEFVNIAKVLEPVVLRTKATVGKITESK